MIVFVILLMAVMIWQIDFSSFHHDYLRTEQSTAIKGVFAVIVFLSHTRGYAALGSGIGDRLFEMFIYAVGQSMVAIFFFYSGYGVMESYKHKQNYVNGFFKKRILKTLVHFDLAVLLYILLNIFSGRHRSLQIYMLSLIGWTSIGNSNWFICVLLMLYTLTLLVFGFTRLIRKENEMAISRLVVTLSIALWALLAYIGMPGYWYNTLLCYGAGMTCSNYKMNIDSAMKNNRVYYSVMICIFCLLGLCYILRGSSLVYSIFTILVSLLIVTVTMKVRITNPFLQFLGRYSFSIFILQRLPMSIIRMTGIISPIPFTVLAFLCTLILSALFDILLSRADAVLFN